MLSSRRARRLCVERTMVCTLALCVVGTLVFVGRAYSTAARLLPTGPEPRPISISGNRYGDVASSSATCSNGGLAMLELHGNAVDAAIATEFCLGVVGMQWTGLGGGGFALVRAINGSYSFVDFRETAPIAAFRDMYNTDVNASIFGGLARRKLHRVLILGSGVPGELQGLEYLHQQYGSLPWDVLLEPSINLARDGFVVSSALNWAMNLWGPDSFPSQDATWAIDFAPNGTRVGSGDTMFRKRYANLLESIAHEGPDASYTGTLAEATIRALQQANGTMTLDDLQQYKVALRRPVELKFGDYKIVSCGAPGGGSVVLSTMNIIKGYAGSVSPTDIKMSTYHLDQAIRFAYGQRVKLGDPSFVPGVDEWERDILSYGTGEYIRSKISDQHTLPISAYNPDGLKSADSHGTSHLVTADSLGMVVSLTSTVNLGFGSHLMVPETGLILNNEMNDFSIPDAPNADGYQPAAANYIAPGKRPLSSMSPSIAYFAGNQTFYYATGAARGSHIITSTIQSLWRVLSLQQSAREAIDAPRFHDQLIPDRIMFEPEYDHGTVAYLRDKGLNTTWSNGPLSFTHALKRHTNGTFEAVPDPRVRMDPGSDL
ncbi:Glutathione hydrolase proenzyme [Fulvia fulva]|uniref:Glutathione hydrolase n=1 Tax=Passalora fulva TaxID=5499 RepID=A0A9Q8UU51_PASFU|nr:Glutathione hydrolase proenzyme [Fulvia fulva]UJO22525.1 Glutathione hydrolase proenzyme [Fulvia fulva]